MNQFEELYRIWNQWLYLYEEEIGINDILERKGFRCIAIYGMGDGAIHLINSLQKTKVNVRYVIDENEEEYSIPVSIIGVKNVSNEVDVVVDTRPCSSDEDRYSMEDVLGCKVISLADIIFDMLE